MSWLRIFRRRSPGAPAATAEPAIPYVADVPTTTRAGAEPAAVMDTPASPALSTPPSTSDSAQGDLLGHHSSRGSTSARPREGREYVEAHSELLGPEADLSSSTSWHSSTPPTATPATAWPCIARCSASAPLAAAMRLAIRDAYVDVHGGLSHRRSRIGLHRSSSEADALEQPGRIRAGGAVRARQLRQTALSARRRRKPTSQQRSSPAIRAGALGGAVCASTATTPPRRKGVECAALEAALAGYPRANATRF